MPRALIIGHSGQDGSLLWEQLAARGFELVGLSRRGVRAHEVAWDAPVDIGDPGAVHQFVDAFRPDQVYFLAAHHHSSEQLRSDDADLWRGSWQVHVHAFGHVLAAAADCCPQARIFYASSSRIFGDAETSPQNEDTPLRPSCIYGVTKASGMLLADYYRRVHGLFVACGILFNHESPLRGPQFVTRRVVDGLVELKRGSRSSFEIGSLDARVDWGYAPDYTRAMQMILDGGQAEDFVVASGRTHSVRELAATAAQYLNLDWEDRVVETSAILQRDAQELCGDAARLRAAVGWKPSVDFRGMVRILVDAALARTG
jgi:GDPmannose 4,6-dehydratase